ncbi:hypothetical protein AGR7A_pTi0071 [Agrobacterium deltaense NCPPB 1641]|uniref:Uncharacterized protein n=1 Tax=Agrobacterium deltaense NCPPB 1641 TaxID=1183425 RepID=A0A1S7UBY8_9HYPH|nr:hypothetical protein AGR7A_pTi0071 [Agrobacterium deltaense NCPPB 1641]
MPRPTFHDIGGDFIGRDILQHCRGIAVSGQPLLCRQPACVEVNKLGIAAGTVEDAATADQRAFDEGEHQSGVQRKRAMDADRDHAAAAIITFMQREAGRTGYVAATSLISPSDQPAAAVVRLPS